MMDADKAVYRMGNSNYAFILRDASREEAAAFLEKIRARLEESVGLENNHFDLKIYASGIILDQYEGEISTVQSKQMCIRDRLSLAVVYGPMMIAEYLPYGMQKALDLIPLVGSSTDICRTNTFRIFGKLIWSPYLLITIPVLIGILCMPFAIKNWSRRMKA